MPLMDFDAQATWDALYETVLEDGSVAHYTRAAKAQYFGGDPLKVAPRLAGARLVVIGAGFGWAAEDWLAAGVPSLVCTDTSAWIQARKAAESTLPILAADVLARGGRAAILAAIGGAADVIVTEDVLPCLSDSEAVAMAQACRLVAPTVIHWISCGPGYAPLNWKPLDAWKALVGPDVVVNRGSAAAL